MRIFFQCCYAMQLLYPINVALTKFSILLFFRRMFTVHEKQLPILITGAIVAMWMTATVSLPVLVVVSMLKGSCRPWQGYSPACPSTDFGTLRSLQNVSTAMRTLLELRSLISLLILSFLSCHCHISGNCGSMALKKWLFLLFLFSVFCKLTLNLL